MHAMLLSATAATSVLTKTPLARVSRTMATIVAGAVEIAIARTVLEPNAHEWDVRGWWERRGREAEEAEEARVVRAVNDTLRDLAR